MMYCEHGRMEPQDCMICQQLDLERELEKLNSPPVDEFEQCRREYFGLRTLAGTRTGRLDCSKPNFNLLPGGAPDQ